MKFNAVIGNPPYQETKGGTKNVQIWQYFVEIGNKITEKYASFIHPGRWVVPKSQMESVRDNLLNQGLKEFDYYPNSTDVFTNVGIDGGISITNFEKGYKGKSNYLIKGKQFGEYDKKVLFISNEYEDEIVKKIGTTYKTKINSRLMGNPGALGGGFGYDKRIQIKKLKKTDKGMKNPIKIWANPGEGKGSKLEWFYIETSDLDKKSLPSGIFNSRKIMLSKTGHAGEGDGQNIFNNLPEIVDKNATGENILYIFPQNDTDYELKLIQTLFATKTARFLMSLTQKDLYVRGFENIPDYTYFQAELEQMGQASDQVRAENEKQGYRYWFDESDKKWKALFSDKYFYDKFGFSQELIDYIESHISEKKV